jgi:hypothetical protein
MKARKDPHTETDMTLPKARAAHASKSLAPRRAPGPAAPPSSISPCESRAALLHGEAPIDARAREDLIREQAYLRAERRGFCAGHELEDWLVAEREFDEWLATRGAPHRYGK